ncbi:MAG: phage protease [Paracoccus sp. (in: a-proteobacteria)]|uniref:phage protease n=1 Tax=Paracoccus sp. TaxID=267 RepID=UPI0026E00881|nr:phage protease [Paracoccus sp. (in: a-proteobacteria)]MDO5631128.1 phage protease [Paracoccus sp. (in: a-proteobacteria)]
MSTKPETSSFNSNHAATEAAVLAFQIAAPDPTHAAVGSVSAPEWVQVFPAGPVVTANDGRVFRLTDPAALVARIMAGPLPILVDYDHRSHFDPTNGGDSVAAGWSDLVEVRADGIWARVEWTAAAAARIVAREWRFISPEFRVDQLTGEIVALSAISLVNRPAFSMAALARSQTTNGDSDMKAIAKALGLSDDADEAAILTAIETGRIELAAAQAAPAPDRYMPRADYDTALARATSAEAEVASIRKAARDAEIETVLTAAVSEGKIAPASKPHYVALAATDAGFEQVKQLCAALPKVIADPNVTLPAAPSGTLSDTERHIAASLGLSEADFIKTRGAAA